MVTIVIMIRFDCLAMDGDADKRNDCCIGSVGKDGRMTMAVLCKGVLVILNCDRPVPDPNVVD